MTVLLESPTRVVFTDRVARPRRYLMCPPDHFTVEYAINPWMDTTRPVDLELAREQWDGLRQIYVDLGHSVEVIQPEPGPPDMVFAANGGLVIRGRALSARFAHPANAFDVAHPCVEQGAEARDVGAGG